jgi:hypothetical protein
MENRMRKLKECFWVLELKRKTVEIVTESFPSLKI